MSDTQKEILEVIVTINLGPVIVTIKGSDISSLDDILQKYIEVGKKNESRIKELMSIFGSALPQALPMIPSTQLTVSKSMVDFNSYNDIVEIIGNTVKFTSKNTYDLTNKEAIALLMYFWEKPVQPKDADEMLVSGWKKVKKIANYFVDASQLKPFVIKKDDGYVLAGNGKRWVEEKVIPKLRGQLPPL